MKRSLKVAAFAAVAALGSFGLSQSHAATAVVNPVSSGEVIDGWEITIPTGIQVDQDVQNPNDPNSLFIENMKQMGPGTLNEGLVMTFEQVDPTAASTLTINNETVTNLTGSTIGAFAFQLINGVGANASFTGSIFTADGYYNNVTSSSTLVTYTGSQPNNTTQDFGMGTDGNLVIDLNPQGVGTVVNFKEYPQGGGTVPLPAAALQGLAGLAGLGLIAAAKKKVLA